MNSRVSCYFCGLFHCVLFPGVSLSRTASFFSSHLRCLLSRERWVIYHENWWQEDLPCHQHNRVYLVFVMCVCVCEVRPTVRTVQAFVPCFTWNMQHRLSTEDTLQWLRDGQPFQDVWVGADWVPVLTLLSISLTVLWNTVLTAMWSVVLRAVNGA